MAPRLIPTRIIIFAKAPVPGKVKTRLIPALGEIGAARLAHQMLIDTVAEAVAADLGVPELCVSPHRRDPEWRGFLSTLHLRVTGQGNGDLGERLARAAERSILLGERVLLIGTDCPALNSALLRAAAAMLETNDAVLQPTLDGGYALLGLNKFDKSLFSNIPWSTDSVAAKTTARIEALGWSLFTGETLRDIDEPADLQGLQPC